jgi:hypothetical protein
MATFDEERRSVHDYVREARTNHQYDSSVARWVSAAVFLLILGFIFFLFLAAPSQDPTGGRTVSPSETAPTTTAVPQSPTPAPTAPTTQPK